MTTYLQDVRELQRQFAANVAGAQMHRAGSHILVEPQQGHDILGALATLIQMLEDRDGGNACIEDEVSRLDDAIANLRALVLP